MNIRPMLIAAVLAAAAVAASAAPTPPVLTVQKFTGVITIKTGAGLVTVKPGDKVPAIHSGDEITVVSGHAVFSANGETVTGQAGSAFSVSAAPLGVIQFSVTAGSVVVTKADRSLQTVKTGESYNAIQSARPSIPSEIHFSLTGGSAVPVPTPTQTKSVVSPSAPN